MTIHTVLQNSKIPIVETEILLSAVLKKDRSFINSFPETELTRTQQLKIKDFLDRRVKNEPIPYIVGFKDFFGLKFLVDQNVLIPRPETETLVEKLLTYCSKQENKALTVIDIGTGSGCIAITLAVKNPNLNIIASDISPKALEIASKNAKLHRVENKISFVQSNLLEKIDEKVDVIAANLPYIPTANWEKLPKEIKNFEPKIALDSGENSMPIYKKLFGQAKSKLNKTGRIFYEIDGEIIQVSAADLAETLPE